MSLKRISLFVPLVLVASFGMLVSCGEKEDAPADAAEEAADEAGEAEAADDASDE